MPTTDAAPHAARRSDLPAEIHAEVPVDLHALLPCSVHALCTQQRDARGALLFEAGRRPVWVHFVDAGEVVLRRNAEDGEAAILQRSRRGFIGEASLQADRYHCDAVAVADTRVTRIPLPALQAALTSDAAFALRWIGMLNKEVRRLREQCERLTFNTVEARLVHLIRTHGDAAGLPIASGLKTLAREIGVTHEALYRCVARMEKGALLQRIDGRLQLPTAAQPAHAARP